MLVRWTDSPGGPRRVAKFGPYDIDFEATEAVRDHVFRIPYFQVPGVGRYAIVLVRKQPRDWKGREFVKLTDTHFYAERWYGQAKGVMGSASARRGAVGAIADGDEE